VSDDAHARARALLDGDPVPEVRREAARALGVPGDPDSVESLIAALEDPNDGVRRVATLALGRIREPRVADALLHVLSSQPELWQEASAALATAADRDVLPRLVELLDADSSHVRCGALRAIAALTKADTSPESIQPTFVYTDAEGHQHPLF
jgi:HEAT repeat protein